MREYNFDDTKRPTMVSCIDPSLTSGLILFFIDVISNFFKDRGGESEAIKLLQARSDTAGSEHENANLGTPQNYIQRSVSHSIKSCQLWGENGTSAVLVNPLHTGIPNVGPTQTKFLLVGSL